MKQTTFCVGISLGLTILVLLAQPSTGARNSPTEDWVRHVLELLDNVAKRGCVGYMCAYHHMGSATASRSRYNHLHHVILPECLDNPLCSPGKRRRRSVLLSRLSGAASQPSKQQSTFKTFSPQSYAGTRKLKRNRKENVNFITQ